MIYKIRSMLGFLKLLAIHEIIYYFNESWSVYIVGYTEIYSQDFVWLLE